MLYDIPLHSLSGQATTLAPFRSKAMLIVNVASECGLTPQYEQLQALFERYGERGFTVVGFPCNQFGAQEPGSAAQIQSFCTKNYGVTFPLMEKIEVNGPGRHPVYDRLTAIKDAGGKGGDIVWNFEKFLVAPEAKSITRFRPDVEPDDPAIVSAIERVLPSPR